MAEKKDDAANTERELALALGKVDPARIAKHPLVTALAIDRAVSEKLVSTYYDTADRALIADDTVLRVRQTPKKIVQTIKAGGPKGAGMAARDEWEIPLQEPVPHWPPSVPGAIGQELARLAARSPLEPVFATDFTRTRRRLVTPGGDVVELAIDIGEVRAGRRSVPIAEVELELEKGSATGLFDLALGLMADLPLTLQTVSKGERGYQLAAGDKPAAFYAPRPALEPNMSVGQTFDLVLPSAAGQAINNTPCILEGTEPVEGVHQMRVGLRRLRAGLAIFKPYLTDKDRALVRGAIKPLLNVLGPVRDLDVFLSETMPPITAAFAGDAAIGAFIRQATTARDHARAELCAVLETSEHARIWLTVGRWLAERPIASDDGLTVFARRVLDKRARRVKKSGKKIVGGPIEALHALRIEIKNLRYASEFFADLYDDRQVKPVLKALRTAQDSLGHLHDLAVSDAVIAKVEASTSGRQVRDVTRGAGMVRGWMAAHQSDRRVEAEKAYAKFARLEYFWR